MTAYTVPNWNPYRAPLASSLADYSRQAKERRAEPVRHWAMIHHSNLGRLYVVSKNGTHCNREPVMAGPCGTAALLTAGLSVFAAWPLGMALLPL